MTNTVSYLGTSYINLSDNRCEHGHLHTRAIGKVKLFGDHGAVLILNICTKCHALNVDDGLSGMVFMNPKVLEAKP